MNRNEYYDRLAPSYDESRFGNSYGRFLDGRERATIGAWLAGTPRAQVVDLGCGTGRMLAFAETGVDGSERMLAEARARWPDRTLVHATVTDTGLATGAYTAATCLHVLMHLDVDAVRATFAEVARIVRPGGRFLVDIPSAPRRALGRRANHGWHADTAASVATLNAWAGPSWSLRAWHGLLTIPVHRVPARLRPALASVDRWLGDSPVAPWASYYLCELVRT